MDLVSSKLQEWGFGSLIELFKSHEIDEEGFLLLDKESLRALVPQIGLCLKLEKKISDYRKECCQQDSSFEMPLSNAADQHSLVCEDQQIFDVVSSSPLPSSQPFDNCRIKVTKFDVVTVVFEHCPEIGETLKNGNQISYLEKLRLSRVLVKNCLIKKCGVFPTSEEKELLAKELISAFLPLKGADGTGYEQWFCKGVKNKTGRTTPNRGHLEENLRNWRQRLNPNDKQKYGVKTYKTKGLKRNVPPTSEETFNFSVNSLEKQQWLKENSAPINVVSQYMMETCLERHKHIIMTSPSITNILDQWPKLLLINQIDQDFTQIYSKEACDSLCKEFGLIARIILLQGKNCGRTLAEKRALELTAEIRELPDTDQLIVSTAEINAALILLPYLLPQGVINNKKKFRPTLDQTRRHFIDELPEGSNIAEIINSRTAEDKTRTQPFMIVTGNKFCPSDIYIILEKAAIQTDSLLKAVDVCFKLHFLLNVEYSRACCNVYNFLNNSFYKIGDYKDGIHPVPFCVKELRQRLFV